MVIRWMMLLVFSGGLLGQQLEAPPRDLASLLDPQTALQQMGAPTDEAGLLALLTAEAALTPEDAALKKVVADLGAADFKTRQAAAEVLKAAGAAARPFLEQAAKSDDPEVSLTAWRLLEDLKDVPEVRQRPDMDYVKKLMAVRLLGKTKSQAALPALKKLTMAETPTLADAAREAVALIEGRPVPRPSGQDALKAICEKLPADVASLALMDVERGAKAQTVSELIDGLKKALADPAAAPMLGMMGDAGNPAAQLDRILPQARTGVIDVLAKVGNIRVDAVAMVVPDRLGSREFGSREESFYMAWVLKGLWDPKRLAALCGSNHGFTKNREVAGHIVYVNPCDHSVCLLDEHTMVLAVFPGTGNRVEGLISALASEKTGKLPAAPAQALETTKNENVRIAVASSQLIGRKLQAWAYLDLESMGLPEPGANVAEPSDWQVAVCRMQPLFAMLDTEQLIGQMSTKGDIVLHATSKDEAAAQALETTLKALDGKLRALLTKTGAGNGAPDVMRTMMEGLAENALWTTERNGKQVTVRANLLALLLTGRAVRHVHPVARPIPVEPVPPAPFGD